MKTVIATDAGARPVGPYSQAIRANGLIFVSGQIPFDPETAAIVDGSKRFDLRGKIQHFSGVGLASHAKARFMLALEDQLQPELNRPRTARSEHGVA